MYVGEALIFCVMDSKMIEFTAHILKLDTKLYKLYEKISNDIIYYTRICVVKCIGLILKHLQELIFIFAIEI